MARGLTGPVPGGPVTGRTLVRSFYDRDARVVAPDLLNKILVRSDEIAPLAARLVEVEAYAGVEDPGSHGYRGETSRNGTMFGPAGHLYVYFTYGIHFCANVVCGDVGVSSAVLLRAAVPLAGLEAMWARRAAARREVDLCSGPAKLTQAFGLARAHDGADLVDGPLRLLDDGTPPPAQPIVTTRIGIREGRGEDLPWRWLVAGDPHVSRGRPG